MSSKKRTRISALALMLGSTFFLAGCEPKGPAEKAGEQLDKGVQSAKDAITPPGPVERAGREVDKATGNK